MVFCNFNLGGEAYIFYNGGVLFNSPEDDNFVTRYYHYRKQNTKRSDFSFRIYSEDQQGTKVFLPNLKNQKRVQDYLQKPLEFALEIGDGYWLSPYQAKMNFSWGGKFKARSQFNYLSDIFFATNYELWVDIVEWDLGVAHLIPSFYVQTPLRAEGVLSGSFHGKMKRKRIEALDFKIKQQTREIIYR